MFFIGMLSFSFLGRSQNAAMQLVWADEFNGSGALDTAKWFHQTLLPNGNSWFNGEIQHYTDRTVNSSVSNGTMKLIAKKENYTDQGVTKNYTSARLNSKFAFTYGRVEIRAKLPQGAGTWPALWMLGQNITERGAYWQQQGYGQQGWPDCGEIDIIEHWGRNQDYVASALHTPSSFGNTMNKGGRTIPGVSQNFHVYAMEWTPTKIVFSVDSVVHYTYQPSVRNASTWPYDKPQYLLLNIAIEPSIALSFTEDTLEVDYLRVYQNANVGLGESKTEQPKLYPNPVQDQFQVQFHPSIHGEHPYTIRSLSGQALHRGSVHFQKGQARLNDLNELPAGLYCLLVAAEAAAPVTFVKK